MVFNFFSFGPRRGRDRWRSIFRSLTTFIFLNNTHVCQTCINGQPVLSGQFTALHLRVLDNKICTNY